MDGVVSTSKNLVQFRRDPSIWQPRSSKTTKVAFFTSWKDESEGTCVSTKVSFEEKAPPVEL